MKPPTLVLLASLVLLSGLQGCTNQGNLEDSTYERSDQLQMAIRRTIPDDDRAEQLTGLQAVVGEEMRRFYRACSWFEDDAVRANADYDITPDAFERIADGLARDRRRTMDTIVRIAMRLRSEMTPEEWARLTEEMR